MSPQLFFRLATVFWYVYMLGVSVLLALWIRHRWFLEPAAGAPAPDAGKDAIAMVVLGVLVANGLFVRWFLHRQRQRLLPGR